jgi:hypothetical protein
LPLSFTVQLSPQTIDGTTIETVIQRANIAKMQQDLADLLEFIWFGDAVS